MAESMRIGEAIERQRYIGQTSAQHQTTDTGEFIRRANDSARRSLDASRNRGPVDPETGMASRDMSHIDPQHVEGIGRALVLAIRRATARVGQVFPLAGSHVVALEKALQEEIAAEFWDMEHQHRGEVEGRTLWEPGTGPDSVTGAMHEGGTVASSGTVDSAGTVESTGTV